MARRKKSERVRALVGEQTGWFSTHELVVELEDVSIDTVRAVLRQMHSAGEVTHNAMARAHSRWKLSSVADDPTGAPRTKAGRVRAFVHETRAAFTSGEVVEALGDVSVRTVGVVLTEMLGEGEVCHNGGFHASSVWARPGVPLPGATTAAERIRAHVGRIEGVFTSREVTDALDGVSASMTRTTLRAMRDEGLILHNGQRSLHSRWAPVALGQSAFADTRNQVEQARDHILARDEPFSRATLVAELAPIGAHTVYCGIRAREAQLTS